MNVLRMNTALWLPLSIVLLVQFYKFFGGWARKGRFDLRTLFTTGGMPSSHSAMVCSLATVMGYEYGLDSPFFAMSVIFAVIVMYDARGVRQESGKQARVLNQIVLELFSGKPISEQKLKELLGHTSTEVIVGALVGVVYSFICLTWFVAEV